MVSLGVDFFIKKSPEGKTAISFEELGNVELFLCYFGAKWCPNSEKFRPILLDFYNTVNNEAKIMEIVYISCDNLESEANSVFEEVPWLTTEFSNQKTKNFMRDNGITTMPSLILLRHDGSIAKRDCRADVQKVGIACLEEWRAAVSNHDEISLLGREKVYE